MSISNPNQKKTTQLQCFIEIADNQPQNRQTENGERFSVAKKQNKIQNHYSVLKLNSNEKKKFKYQIFFKDTN